jgi:hypothetical protein
VRFIKFYPITYPAVTGPVFRQATQPIRAPIPARPRGGRIGSNPGGPLRNPHPSPVYPQQRPDRIRPSLPPRGRITSNPGGPLRNPQPGPAFRQAVRPARPVIPQNAPRGRTGSNPGGPVQNIPTHRILITTGDPFLAWETTGPFTAWDTAVPFLAWETSTPFTIE